MTLVAGASQYVNAANLAIQQGRAAQAPSLIGDMAVGLLDVGRNVGGSRGVGLSARSRALTQQYLSNASSLSNALLSAGAEEYSSIENLQKQILALRSSTPESQLSREFQSDLGSNVDTTA